MRCCIFLDRYQTNSNDQNQNSKKKICYISKEKVNYYYFFLLKRVACETNSSEERHAGSFIYQAHLNTASFVFSTPVVVVLMWRGSTKAFIKITQQQQSKSHTESQAASWLAAVSFPGKRSSRLLIHCAPPPPRRLCPEQTTHGRTTMNESACISAAASATDPPPDRPRRNGKSSTRSCHTE